MHLVSWRGAWESNFPIGEKSCALRGSFPIESPPMQEAQCWLHRTCTAAPGGAPADALSCRWRHTVPFVSVTPQPVRAVTQWTRATQLSNFDNALLCSAFKFYYTFARELALSYVSPSLLTTEKCSECEAQAQHLRCTFTVTFRTLFKN